MYLGKLKPYTYARIYPFVDFFNINFFLFFFIIFCKRIIRKSKSTLFFAP